MQGELSIDKILLLLAHMELLKSRYTLKKYENITCEITYSFFVRPNGTKYSKNWYFYLLKIQRNESSERITVGNGYQ